MVETHSKKEIEVVFVSFDGKKSNGIVICKKLSDDENKKKALKFLFSCFAAAIVMIVIPPHFLWFLSLTTMGVVGYFLKKRGGDVIEQGNGVCPACQNQQLLKESTAEFPLIHFCSHCGERLEIYPAAELPAHRWDN